MLCMCVCVFQKQKLSSELDLVKGNLTVMTEMLNQLRPGESSPSDTELLQVFIPLCASLTLSESLTQSLTNPLTHLSHSFESPWEIRVKSFTNTPLIVHSLQRNSFTHSFHHFNTPSRPPMPCTRHFLQSLFYSSTSSLFRPVAPLIL